MPAPNSLRSSLQMFPCDPKNQFKLSQVPLVQNLIGKINSRNGNSTQKNMDVHTGNLANRNIKIYNDDPQ